VYLRVYLEEAAGAEILTLRTILETCSFSKAVTQIQQQALCVIYIYISTFFFPAPRKPEDWISDRPSAADRRVAGSPLCVCVCVCLG
jgi:hypothetical protein